ncbi:DUF7563 family protein [Halostella limicola]|jgi:hypothetical protein
MPECNNCGSFVTPDFARVFGGNEDEVYGCLDCVGATAVKNGAGLDQVEARTSL